MSDMKLCKDCKQFNAENELCKRVYRDFINGEPEEDMECFNARVYEPFCGVSAKHFIPKVPEPPEIPEGWEIIPKDECCGEKPDEYIGIDKITGKATKMDSSDGIKTWHTDFYTYLRRKQDKLRLEVKNGILFASYAGMILLRVEEDGELYALWNTAIRTAYEKWLKDGKPVDHASVVWRGGRYGIGSDWTLKRTDMDHGRMYGFANAFPFQNCTDPNIKRYSNGTPILH